MGTRRAAPSSGSEQLFRMFAQWTACMACAAPCTNVSELQCMPHFQLLCCRGPCPLSHPFCPRPPGMSWAARRMGWKRRAASSPRCCPASTCFSPHTRCGAGERLAHPRPRWFMGWFAVCALLWSCLVQGRAAACHSNECCVLCLPRLHRWRTRMWRCCAALAGRAWSLTRGTGSRVCWLACLGGNTPCMLWPYDAET